MSNNTHTRIAQLLKLALLSDKEGEILAALNSLRKTLETAGLDIHEFADHAGTIQKRVPWPSFAAGGVDWRTKITFIIINDGYRLLSDLEKKFIKNIEQRSSLSEKQAAWLDALYCKVKANTG